MIIKVCGLCSADNIRQVSDLAPDMIGFHFYQDSPRYVRMIPSCLGSIPDYSRERLEHLRAKHTAAPAPVPETRPLRVGVFEDDMPQNIVTRVYNHALNAVQLQGSESRYMIENLKQTLVPDIVPTIQIIKTLHIASPEDLGQYKDYEGMVDMFLFDLSQIQEGGPCGPSATRLLNHYDGSAPFLIGGGIGPDDADGVASLRHPRFVGVDLNSKFETNPGMKDIALLRHFMAKLR